MLVVLSLSEDYSFIVESCSLESLVSVILIILVVGIVAGGAPWNEVEGMTKGKQRIARTEGTTPVILIQNLLHVIMLVRNI